MQKRKTSNFTLDRCLAPSMGAFLLMAEIAKSHSWRIGTLSQFVSDLVFGVSGIAAYFALSIIATAIDNWNGNYFRNV